MLIAKPSLLKTDDGVHSIEFGLEILNSAVVFPLNLLDQRVELSLRGFDLLLNQVGTILKVVTDVTHLMIPRAI